MQAISSIFEWITGLGGSGILAIALLLLGLVFRVGIDKAVRSALTAAVGFIGLFLVVDMLVAVMGPATTAMVERLGWQLDVVDVGWGLIGMAWGNPSAPFVIITAFALNIFLLTIHFTKTLMIDFWNYWSFCAAGALAYGATQSIWFSVLTAAVYMVICWKVTDLVAKDYQEFYNLPGISFPTGAVIAPILIGVPVIKLLQKIPFIKDVKADPETIQKRFGMFGEPVIIGFVMGCVIGILAGYSAQGIIILGLKMAAVLVLIPKMVQVLTEGLLSISEAAKEFTEKHFEGREVYIGIDATAMMGHPATLSAILIMTPIVTMMSLLPGNKLLAIASLAAIPWFLIPLTSYAKGNVLHIVLSGMVVFAVYFWCATALSGAHTQLAVLTGFNMPEGATMIGSLSEGGNFITWAMVALSKLLGLYTAPF